MGTTRRGDRHNRETRQAEAVERQKERSKRSDEEQLEVIYDRGANEFCREAVRLRSQIKAPS